MSQQDVLMKRKAVIDRLMGRIFSGDAEEARNYGFDNAQVQFYFVETAEKWVRHIRHVGGYLNPDTEEEDLILLDDAWLKIAQIMWTRDRKLSRGQRKTAFAGQVFDEWALHAISDVVKRH